MKTKIILLAFAVASFIFFTSCDNLTDVTFTYSTADVTFTYGPDSLTGTATIMEKNIKNPIDSIFKSNNADISKLKEVKLKSCHMTIILPDSSNFNSISDFEIYISTQALPQVKIASINPVPQDTNNINFTVAPQDLTEYIKSPEINYLLKGTKIKPVNKAMTIKVHTEFEVTAGSLL